MPSDLIETCVAQAAKESAFAGELDIRGSDTGWDRSTLGEAHPRPEGELCFFVLAPESGEEVALGAQPAGLDPLCAVEAAPSEGRPMARKPSG